MKPNYYFFIFSYFFIITFQSFSQQNENTISKKHFDASFETYSTYFDGKICSTYSKTDTVIFIVKSEIPDLKVNLNLKDNIINMEPYKMGDWEFLLKPGKCGITLRANGFVDTTLSKKFRGGECYSLRVNVGNLKNGYSFLRITTEPESCNIEIEKEFLPIKTPIGHEIQKNKVINISIYHPQYSCLVLDTSITRDQDLSDFHFKFPSAKGALSLEIKQQDLINFKGYIKKSGQENFKPLERLNEIYVLDSGSYILNIKKPYFLEEENYMQIYPCDTIRLPIELVSERTKLKRLAIRVSEGESAFKLKNSEFDKIKFHILKHYKEKKNIYMLSEDKSNTVFKKISINKDSLDLSSLKNLKDVKYLLDCKAFIGFENQEMPNQSIIQVSMKLFVANDDKNTFVDFGERLGNYFPAKMDSGFSILDKVLEIDEKYNLLKKLAKFISTNNGLATLGTFAIGSWILKDAICNQTDRKPLPDAPRFPNTNK